MPEQPNAPLTYKGLPFEGQDFSWKEFDRVKPVRKVKAKCRTFLTSSETDMQEYAQVYQKRMEGSAQIGQELREYDLSLPGWRIFLLWGEFYYTKGDADDRQGQSPQKQ